MKFFSDCIGKCEKCYIHYVGGCLAGHGDDDFVNIRKKDFIKIMANKRVSDQLKEQLKEEFPEFVKKTEWR